MDIASAKQQFLSYLKKYQYILLVLAIGISLMLFPQKEKQEASILPDTETSQSDLELELSRILSQIEGVGKTEVLLTEASGKNTIYQTDSSQNNGNLDTVIVTDKERNETGLVKQIQPPVYRGALIVCQGGHSASVRLSIVEAVKSITGLSSDCITVLKMK